MKSKSLLPQALLFSHPEMGGVSARAGNPVQCPRSAEANPRQQERYSPPGLFRPRTAGGRNQRAQRGVGGSLPVGFPPTSAPPAGAEGLDRRMSRRSDPLGGGEFGYDQEC